MKDSWKVSPFLRQTAFGVSLRVKISHLTLNALHNAVKKQIHSQSGKANWHKGST